MWHLPVRWSLLAAVIAAMGVGFAIAAPADSPPKPPGGDNGPGGGVMDSAQYEREVAEARASLVPQTAFLKVFNDGKRRFESLPRVTIDADYSKPKSFEVSLAAADHEVLLQVVRVEFFGSNIPGMEDVPGTRIIYRVVSVGKGPLHPGDEVRLHTLGGPYRDPDSGAEFLLELSRVHTDSVGDRVLALLLRDPEGVYTLAGATTKYGVDVDGRLRADENSVEAGIAGRAVAEVFASLR